MAEPLVGKLGVVQVRVRGGEHPGEVELVVGGIPETFLGYAADEIGVGRRVLVVEDRGGRGVNVVDWDLPG